MPGYLRVFVGEGDQKLHEMDIDLAEVRRFFVVVTPYLAY
jgi:hypothetical protein